MRVYSLFSKINLFLQKLPVTQICTRSQSSITNKGSSFALRPTIRWASTTTSTNKLSTALNSRKLANGLYAGVVLTVIWYVFRGRSKEHHSKDGEVVVGELRRFKGKTVVITGGAGDIGSNTAMAFACEGASVVLVDLPHIESDLKEKCKNLVDIGAPHADYVTCDVTKEESVKDMVKTIADRNGRIDIFFNNAGIQGSLHPLHEQDDKEFHKVIDVNIYGVFLGMKYVSKNMIESGGGGVIVNTASLAGLQGPANMAAYAASKFAVVGMTKTAAKDLALHGIRVCAIAPGLLEGKMWGTQVRGNAQCRKQIRDDTSELTEDDVKEQEARMIDGTPMKRLGKLSEVASVVTFLSSDDASYLTGHTVPIDGGRLP